MSQNSKNTLIFVGLTYLLSWLMAVVYFAFGGVITSKGFSFFYVINMFTPALSAIVIYKYTIKDPFRKTFDIYFKPNRWFYAAWLLPLIIALATNEVGLSLPWHEYSPEMEGFFKKLSETLPPNQVEAVRKSIDILPIPLFWITIIQGMIAGFTISAVISFGEELGWRGYLQRQFSAMGFWKSSALIGIIHGVWQWPYVINGYTYNEHPLAGIFMMIAFTILLAPIVSYFRLKAKSLIAACIFRGTLMGLFGLPIMMISGGNDLTAGMTGVAGFIVLAVVNIIIWIYDRFVDENSLTAKPKSDETTAQQETL